MNRYLIVVVCALPLAAACQTALKTPSNSAVVVGNSGAKNTDKTEAANNQIEKQKPAAGKANVQGRVLYNDQPAAKIEVKLCEKFNQYLGGCSGGLYKAVTDANGEYVVADVPPGKYEALTVKVFDTPYYVFATKGLISSAQEYELPADQTTFIDPTHLFKGDLKVQNPRAGGKLENGTGEVKWDAYPDAAYYKVSLYATDSSVTSPYINERIDGNSLKLEKPLTNGEYRLEISAYNAKDHKLAESPDDYKFTVAGGIEAAK